MQIKANGIEIQYTLEGPDDAPLLTFSHSLATSSELWVPQEKTFKDRYRILRYDTRGHGQTEVTPGPYTFELLADDLRALLREIGESETHFVGLSNGGMVGQSLALRYPEVVCSLTLCDTTSCQPPETIPIWAERALTVEKEGLGPLVESTIERWFSAEFREQQPVVVERFRNLIRGTPPIGYAACCRAIQVFNVTSQLHHIDIPTLILVGEEDRGTTVSEHLVIHEQIRGSEMIVFPRTAHLSNIGACDEFNAQLGRFLDSQEAG